MTSDNAKPSGWSAFLPVLCVIVANYADIAALATVWSASYLSEPRFGSTELSKVMGVWSGRVWPCCWPMHYDLFALSRFLAAQSNPLRRCASRVLLPVFNTANRIRIRIGHSCVDWIHNRESLGHRYLSLESIGLRSDQCQFASGYIRLRFGRLEHCHGNIGQDLLRAKSRARDRS